MQGIMTAGDWWGVDFLTVRLVYEDLLIMTDGRLTYLVSREPAQWCKKEKKKTVEEAISGEAFKSTKT